jgi:UDP-N-acetylglucosamine:LPS N-acetylglucosamine transferase
MTLGKTEESENSNRDHFKIYSFLTREKREDLLNRSKLVISRSGYSTIMDLAIIGTKALMIPTPGQIEQEYLSKYHNEKGTFYSVNQDKIILEKDVEIAKKKTGFIRKCSVKKTVENIIRTIHMGEKSI